MPAINPSPRKSIIEKKYVETLHEKLTHRSVVVSQLVCLMTHYNEAGGEIKQEDFDALWWATKDLSNLITETQNFLEDITPPPAQNIDDLREKIPNFNRKS